jgi:UDP-3-O-[3-hydroxymyristoyl] N-acetylglucosamine deacetylase/3-hydroxyacyl-[acyl-carrier-protein] dehydratase
MVKNQRTIAREVELKGTGLHTGRESRIVLKPAPVDNWIVFRRAEFQDSPPIKAVVDNVIDYSRGTTIGKDGYRIMTVEHLLSASYGCEIDNLFVDVYGEEIPVMDGSAKPFVDAILDAGIVEQEAPKNYFEIEQVITYSNPESHVDIHIVPFDHLRITFLIDYPSTPIGVQYTTMEALELEFVKEFSLARTFCLLSEVKNLLKQGLIRGGKLDSALVICDIPINDELRELVRKNLNLPCDIFVGKSGILNDMPLRYYNEPVRHKVVDLLGDLALLGFPIKGHIIAARSGHRTNAELVRLILKQYQKFQSTKRFRRTSTVSNALLDIIAIEDILPHRYPFLLVDRIIDLEPGKKVVAIKNVTRNEPFFNGHFPGRPVMPGVLIVDAQTGAFLLFENLPNKKNVLIYFLGIDKVRFRKPVVPGDQLVLEVEMGALRGNTGKFFGRAYVDNKLVCEAEMMASIVEKEREE